jgi:hypothetical protein
LAAGLPVAILYPLGEVANTLGMLVQPDDAMRAIIPSSDHGRDAKRFGHGVQRKPRC